MAALQKGEGAGKQRSALLLWEMLHVPAASAVNLSIAAQAAASDALVPGISWALNASASAAAGVVQALTHDNHRCAYSSSCLALEYHVMNLFIAAALEGLVPSISWALHAGTCAAAAGVRALAHDITGVAHLPALMVIFS